MEKSIFSFDKKHNFDYFIRLGGNNSVVECNLAKVEVAGSNPVSRSRNIRSLSERRHSQVAKAAVCKTVIHRFESGCRLQPSFCL